MSENLCQNVGIRDYVTVLIEKIKTKTIKQKKISGKNTVLKNEKILYLEK